MEAIVAFLGSIASIGAAVWAFYEARQSSASADKAKAWRDEIVDRRQLVEISHVYTETRRILGVIADVGPTCTETSIKGLDVVGIARQVDEYVRFINEQSSHFSELFNNRAMELCANLRPEIERLAQSLDFQTTYAAGKAIYYQVFDFMPIAKDLTDFRKEK